MYFVQIFLIMWTNEKYMVRMLKTHFCEEYQKQVSGFRLTVSLDCLSEAVYRFYPNPSGDDCSEVPSELFSKQSDA